MSSRWVVGRCAALIALMVLSTAVVAEDESLKDGARKAGHATGSVFREIGQGAKKAGKEIGQGAKEAGKSIGSAAKEGGREFNKAIKGERSQ
jgi:hypothetical protein